MNKPISDERKAMLASYVSIEEYKEEAELLRPERGRTPGYPTRWHDFNQYLGGGFGSEHRGELVVIAGETNVGKSTFAENLAAHLISRGNVIHYIPLEDAPSAIYDTLCAVTGRESLIEYHEFLKTPRQDLLESYESIKPDELLFHLEYILETSQNSKRPIRVFILDHLNFLFESVDDLRDQTLTIRVIMRQLSLFCRKHKALVLAVSHMNRSKTLNDDGRMTNDRIYGSTSIAQAATKVLLIDQVDETREVRVRMTKSRFTKIPPDHFHFDASEMGWTAIGRRP